MNGALAWMIGVAVLIAAIGTFLGDDIVRIVQAITQEEDGECGPRPANAQVVSDRNFDLSLENSVAVFRGRSSPRLMDSFPKEARSSQMASFMACQVAKQGLITNNDELNEYLRTIQGFFETGRFPEKMSHEGTLKQLRDFVAKDPGQDWSIILSDDISELFVRSIAGATPTELIQKICSSNPCLECEGVSEISSGGTLRILSRDGVSLDQRDVEGVVVKVCAQ